MYLLDTNIVSELRKPADIIDANVRAWMCAHTHEVFYISAITVFELERGVLRMERRDPQQGAMLRAWLNNQVLPDFRDRIIKVDRNISVRAAAMSVPDPAPFRDSLIAASAQVYGLSVLTRNTRDFNYLGVPVVNPWD